MKLDVKFSEHNADFEVDFGQITEIKVTDEEALAAFEAKVDDIKKAVISRGGDISMEAEIDEIPEAILNIPPDASLAFQTDDSAAYKKTVPTGAEKYALLSQLGGMTQKVLKESDNLMPYPYAFTPDAYLTEENGVIKYNRTWAEEDLFNGFAAGCDFDLINENNPITLESGTYIVDGLVSDFDTVTLFVADTYAEALGYGKYRFTLSQTTTISSMLLLQDTTTDPAKTYSFEMRPVLYNEASGAVEFEPRGYELRPTKVTSIVSRGKNLFNISRCVNKVLTDNGDGTYTITRLDEQSVNRFSAVSPIYIPANNTIICSVKTSIDCKVGVYLHLSDGTKTTAYYTTMTSYPRTYDKDVVGVQLFIADTEPVGISVVVSEMQIEFGRTITSYAPFREPISYPIPEELLNLEGVGHGVVGYPNTFDFESEKRKRRSATRVFDGTEQWQIYKTTGIRQFYYTETTAPLPLQLSGVITTFNNMFTDIAITDRQYNYETFYASSTGFCVNTLKCATVDEWKAYLAELYANGTPLTVEYAQKEPIETDLPTTFDPYILVDEGGTLEFVNEHGAAVPSTVKYTIKIGG